MPRNAPSARSRASATLKQRRPSVMMIASSVYRTHDTRHYLKRSLSNGAPVCAENSEIGSIGDEVRRPSMRHDPVCVRGKWSHLCFPSAMQGGKIALLSHLLIFPTFEGTV